MPVLQKAPVYRQVLTVQETSNMQNHQQGVKPCPLLELPQLPQLQPVPHPQQGQPQQAHFLKTVITKKNHDSHFSIFTKII